MKKLCIAFLALVAAAGITSAADQKTLTVWYPETDEASKEIAAQWQSAHPDVKLNVVLKGGDYKQELQLALQSGEGPDLCAVNQSASEMGLFADQGLVISLDPYLKKYGWARGIGSSFLKPDYWDTKTHRLGTAGQTYSIANAIESAIVYYNKDLFARAGITRTPTTWEEWEQDADMLKKAGITPIISGIAGQDGWCALHQVEVQVERFMSRKQANAFVFAEKGASFNIPEVIKGAKNIQGWVKKGYYNDGFTGVGWDDSEKMFVAGRGAMFMSGTWAAQDFTRLAKETPINWDVFKLPSHMVFGSVATGWGISKSCRNPDLAADFLNTWVMDYAIHVKWNMLPMNLDGLTKDKSIELAPQFRHMIDIIGQVSAEDGIGYYFDWPTPSMYDTMTANCQKLMGMQITPEDFARTIDKDLQAYIASRK